MMTLKQYQSQFLANLINPEASHHPERFAIYNKNWRYGLIKVLVNIYPICERLTGKKFFKTMANHYVTTHYATGFSLNDYGYNFPEFITTYLPAASLPYLPDVAKLEWTVHQSSISKSNQTLDPHSIYSNLQRINEVDNLELFIVENGRLISSDYPIHKIWETNQEDYVGETIVNLEEGPAWLLVWHKDLELRIEVLEKQEWLFLKKIQEREILS